VGRREIHREDFGESEGLRTPQSADDRIELIFVCCSARWLKESGISDREYKYWIAQKPKCHASTEGFRSVRLQDFYPALLVYGYGLLLSTAVLIAETLHRKLRCFNRRY